MENFKLADVGFYAALEKETLLKILSEKPIIKSDNDTLDLKFPGLHAIQLKKMWFFNEKYLKCQLLIKFYYKLNVV